MLSIVKKVGYVDLQNNLRLDVKYYYLGEVISSILDKFKTQHLSDFTKSIRKGVFDLNSKNYRKSGVPFIRISNLKAFTIDESGLIFIPDQLHKQETKTQLIPGDLALSKIGKYLGKIAIIPSRYPEVNTSQNIVAVAFNCRKNIARYIYLYLTTRLAITQIIRTCKQHNQNKLTLPDIRKLKIPLLSSDRINYYAEKAKKIIHYEADSYKLINEAKKKFYHYLSIDFTQIPRPFVFESTLNNVLKEGFLTPEYSNPLYNEVICRLRKHKTLELSDIATCRKGAEVGSENYNLYIEKDNYDVPFIRTSDIVNHEVDNYPDFFIEENIYSSLSQKLCSSEILFSKDGSIGNVAMITDSDRIIVSSGFSILHIKSDTGLSPYYIFCALALPEIGYYQALKRTVIASTIPHIRNDNLMKIEIPILDMKYRDEIAKKVEKSFLLKAKRKQALEIVKGELEVEFAAKV